MSIIPSLRASTSRASSSSFVFHRHPHVRLSIRATRAYATAVAEAKPKPPATPFRQPQVMTVQELDRQKESQELLKRAEQQKQRRYGNQVSSVIDMQQLQLPVFETLTMKDFEKRWLWVGLGRAMKEQWRELADTPGYYSKMTLFGQWAYREKGFAQFVPRGFWSFCYAIRDRFLWLVQWYRQNQATQQTLDHCRREGLMLMTPSHERPVVGWREAIRRFFALGHVYRDWDPSMREFFNLYVAYHQALTRRDVETINRTSVGTMRANGLKIAQSGAKMTWELVGEPELPKIRWARQIPLPETDSAPKDRQLVQICCSFDTVQRLHVKSQRARTTRVLDNIVFQFVTPEEPSGIVMRDRVGLDSPKHVLWGAELARVEEKEAAQERDLMEIQRRQAEEARKLRNRV